MGHQGHLLTDKPGHLRRKRDTKVTIEQVKAPHTAEVTSTDHFDSGSYLQFESRESIFNGILEALRDDNISRVAVYGLGGSGKTTLAKQVGKRVMELNLFNVVVFVCVSYTPNVKSIQGQIADQLGLVMGEDDDIVARQRQILLTLRNEGRVLMIFDDLWERLDLQRVGISGDCDHLACKVLLTSRSRVVGYLMECEVSLNLYLLTEEEAFLLFRRHSGIYDGSPDILDLAKEVTKRCEGHPLLISVVGSALRGKTVALWWRALETFPDYDKNYSHIILGCSQLIYNSISNKVAKTIFLIMGLFPGYHEILTEDLSQYAIRLGLCRKNEVTAAINSLKDSCLLMPSHKSKDHVTMHDLVREMALYIVCTENPTYEDSIREYLDALSFEGIQWQKELSILLPQLYGVREHPSSSTSDVTFSGGGEDRVLQVVQPYHCIKAATIPKPSGKLVDFYGLCQVDKSFLPLLKDVCSTKHHLIESQRRHSVMLRQSAFECLGRVLFLLHNVRKRDLVYHKDELEMFWEQLKVIKFDLDWLRPTVEGVFSSADTARIEALRKEENHWNEEAAKLRDQLKIVEKKAAAVRTEIAHIESKLDGFAVAEFSNVRVVSKVTPFWKKFFSGK